MFSLLVLSLPLLLFWKLVAEVGRRGRYLFSSCSDGTVGIVDMADMMVE